MFFSPQQSIFSLRTKKRTPWQLNSYHVSNGVKVPVGYKISLIYSGPPLTSVCTRHALVNEHNRQKQVTWKMVFETQMQMEILTHNLGPNLNSNPNLNYTAINNWFSEADFRRDLLLTDVKTHPPRRAGETPMSNVIYTQVWKKAGNSIVCIC